ncbi:MAG TPA: DUF3369 domain-containing protein [Beijerinckiaceae bacterium]
MSESRAGEEEDLLTFLPDTEPEVPAKPCWRIAVVDDDPAVHEGTRFALSGFSLDGAGLEILSAYSAAEARELFGQRRDIAVVLLDVVMESDDAGLAFVNYLRRDLRNETVRIILRTGQPGQAPEQRVIVDYDINDYKAKTELTADRLYTSLIAALRAYQQLKRLEETRRGLEIIIEAAPTLFDLRSMRRLAEGVLTQVASLLDASCAGILVLREDGAPERITVLAGSGCYEAHAGCDGIDTLDPDIAEAVVATLRQRANAFGERQSTLYVRASGGREIVVVLRADRALSATDRALIELFASRLSVAFDNVFLYEQVQEANARLEARVTERTAELLRANRQLAAQRSDLRRANVFKSEILGTVAHDLKNPLSVILARAEMMREFLTMNPPQLGPMLAQIDHVSASGARLKELVDALIADAMNDALDIKLRREPVDLAGLAAEVVAANEPLAAEKGQSITLSGEIRLDLCGDTERLREAIDNLVSNAIKYTPQGGAIAVRVTRNDQEIACTVTDDGPGLTPEDLGRAFGRFQRLSARPTGGETSTGLGLSIVKRIAELHGGRATAESPGPDQGATFALRFPPMAVELL